MVEKQLRGEKLLVDTGCVAGFTLGIDYDIQTVGNLKSMLFGGEGLFLANLQGTGTVYLQSLPFARLARRIMHQMPRNAGARGERSVLGGLGSMLRGDRD